MGFTRPFVCGLVGCALGCGPRGQAPYGAATDPNDGNTTTGSVTDSAQGSTGYDAAGSGTAAGTGERGTGPDDSVRFDVSGTNPDPDPPQPDTGELMVLRGRDDSSFGPVERHPVEDVTGIEPIGQTSGRSAIVVWSRTGYAVHLLSPSGELVPGPWRAREGVFDAGAADVDRAVGDELVLADLEGRLTAVDVSDDGVLATGTMTRLAHLGEWDGIRAADLDGDGVDELFVAWLDGDPVLGGAWAASISRRVGAELIGDLRSWNRAPRVAELTGDAFADLLVGDRVIPGDGTTDAPEDTSFPLTERGAIAVVDIDGDGREDVLGSRRLDGAANCAGRWQTWVLEHPVGGATRTEDIAGVHLGRDALVVHGDVFGIGTRTLVATSRWVDGCPSRGRVEVLHFETAGASPRIETYPLCESCVLVDLHLADLDGDGILDVLALGRDG